MNLNNLRDRICISLILKFFVLDPVSKDSFTLEFVELRFYMIIVWMLINMLPQAILAFWNLIGVVGFKFEDIRKILFTYPQFILCATFSQYTFGASNANQWCSK